ncbi:hypothetical protein Mtc_0162 [Methanocella conradii HZ254]|uniref:Uncharacterized protein n=1 Tax=Methanocella conradii (strain DSM 24694 / JCM 17849 / CGMCC 1.5162 / HZ254) TaxID=1041930 RepID=H8I6P1_METCZ|nr:hypothetical protein Mtc_0162 [Methanocella conradii HZ254]
MSFIKIICLNYAVKVFTYVKYYINIGPRCNHMYLMMSDMLIDTDIFIKRITH